MSDNAKGLAQQHGLLATEDSDACDKIYKALLSVSDENKADTGYGVDGFDMWVVIGGREYFITARPSNNQIQKDSH